MLQEISEFWNKGISCSGFVPNNNIPCDCIVMKFSIVSRAEHETCGDFVTAYSVFHLIPEFN